MARAAFWLGGLLACLVAPVALAQGGDAVARVDRYLATLTTLSAKFSQVVRNRDGQVTDRASGTLSIARPDRFRWDYQKPYLQTIVADGKRLWLYDRDLAAGDGASRSSKGSATPAMLLSGAGKVGDAFAAAGVETKGDWTWCRLTPKQDDSDFAQVSLAFTRAASWPHGARDKLGQTTVIEFGAVKRNLPLDDKLFRFTPPPGVDVIGRAEP